jgi:hypothetical protein
MVHESFFKISLDFDLVMMYINKVIRMKKQGDDMKMKAKDRRNLNRCCCGGNNEDRLEGIDRRKKISKKLSEK